MTSIDEVIARERQQAKEQRDHIGTFDDEYSKKCEVWAEEHEQIAEWLEELKDIKSDGFTDDLLNMGFTKGYNKAIDECKSVILQTLDNEILVDTLHLRLEQLKAGAGNGTDNQ